MNTPRVLVVDDELSFRLFLKTLFETSGMRVESARNGSEGYDKARANKPSLIVLDVMMPEWGGINMYRKIRTTPELANVPVVMLSAVAPEGFAHALNMIGISETELAPPEAYVEKPPSPDKLLTIVRGLLNQKVSE